MAPELQEIFELIWQFFETGASESNNAWHSPVLGTIGASGPELRMVVLRQADKETRSLVFHSDKRSQKAKELEDSGQVTWLFWDSASGFQIRAASHAATHHDNDFTRQLWKKLPQHVRERYAHSQAPGTALETIAAELLNDKKAFQNFLVVQCQVTFLDCLQIRPEGHLRAWFSWDGQAWNSKWVVP